MSAPLESGSSRPPESPSSCWESRQFFPSADSGPSAQLLLQVLAVAGAEIGLPTLRFVLGSSRSLFLGVHTCPLLLGVILPCPVSSLCSSAGILKPACSVLWRMLGEFCLESHLQRKWGDTVFVISRLPTHQSGVVFRSFGPFCFLQSLTVFSMKTRTSSRVYFRTPDRRRSRCQWGPFF